MCPGDTKSTDNPIDFVARRAPNVAVDVATSEKALAAVRLAGSDPRRAIRLATSAATLARLERDAAAVAVAERALGLAAMRLEDFDAALDHLRRAIRIGRRAGRTTIVAEARMTLAGVLSRNGRPHAALSALDKALVDLNGADHARATGQRGAIMHQIGRLDEAVASYRAALPGLRRADDPMWTQRILSNRGVLHAQRNEFAAAIEDLGAAKILCEENDLPLPLAYAYQNLGFVHARRGDAPAALRYFDQAEDRLLDLGCPLGELRSDRAELLLSLRLFTEAREAAARAVRGFEADSHSLALPEARLILARSALMAGDAATAATQAATAVREFTRQHRGEWAALAALALLNAQRAGAGHPRIGTARLERLAETVAASWPGAAVYARLTAGQLALERGRRESGRRLLADAAGHRYRGPVTARALAWQAAALHRLVDHDFAGAARAARAGLRVIDEHVAALGATDLRANAAGSRVELAAIGLRIAIRGGRPDRVFRWAELGRASHLHNPPARPPDDPVLAELVADLRTVLTRIAELRREGRTDVRLGHRQVVLERAVRDRHRSTTAGCPGRVADAPAIAGLAGILGGTALLEFVQDGGLLHLVTIVDGRPRMRTLAPVETVTELVDRLLFTLRRLCRDNSPRDSVIAAQSLFVDTANRLSTLLLGQTPEIADRSLTLVPTGPLQRVPWAVLPACVGRPVAVTPSAGLLRAGARAVDVGRAAVAAGPDLPGGRAEVLAIARMYGVAPLVDERASVAAVTEAMDGSAIAHLATHGTLRQDNPQFSSVQLADGPLMAHDLTRLRAVPVTVVLAACDTGRPVVLAGDEVMGFAATLLAHGTRNVVAPVVAVHDIDTTPLMVAFHRLLRSGLPPATALATAQQRTVDSHHHGIAAVARFVCFGN
jgi:tetratricopeptide (TPR) repeat protein